MSSSRNTVALEAPPTTEELVLGAARDAILAVGWRKTTLTDIARRAGVSRMTVYRLWPDTGSLLADLMTREWVALEQRVVAQAGDGEIAPEPEEIARLVVTTVRELRAEPLLQRIVELDPELLLPYLLDRRGRSQQHTLDRLEVLIGAGMRTGAVRAGDPRTVARALVLAGHGFVLSAATMAGDGTDVSGLDREFEIFVTAALKP
jgi:AcrR family transcriptional regulator